MDIKKLMVANPVISKMAACEEIFWVNPHAGQDKPLPLAKRTWMMLKPALPASLHISPRLSLKPPAPEVS